MTVTPAPAITEPEPLDDGSDRYRIYIMVAATIPPRFDSDRLVHQQIADTALQCIGSTLVTLRSEGQITGDDIIGIRDRVERTWIVNPYGKGRR